MKKIITASITAIFLSVNVICAQDILFMLPKNLKVASSPVAVKGTVMGFEDISEVDIAVVNIIDLIKGEKTRQEKSRPWLETLEFETIPVRNGLFNKALPIREGINTIIVKPSGVTASPQNISTKVVVLDKTSQKIEIKEPSKDRSLALTEISGLFKKKPYPKTVKITIDALISKQTDGDMKYKMDRIMEITVPVKGKKFSAPVSVREMLLGDEILLITISADDIEITKTLF